MSRMPSPDDRHFEDLGNQPLRVYEAVRALFEMGVVEGTSRNTFSPGRPVTRAEMALAITRMLGHTNARPAGITIQTDGVVVDAEADARGGDLDTGPVAPSCDR